MIPGFDIDDVCLIIMTIMSQHQQCMSKLLCMLDFIISYFYHLEKEWIKIN